jgi:hypothetical protein
MMRTCDGTQRIRRSSRNNETKEARKSRTAGEFKKADVISLALALSERVGLCLNEDLFASLG